MRKFFSLLALCLLVMVAPLKAQDLVPPAPEMEYAFEIQAVCDPAFEVGQNNHGRRVVIPIVGGKVVGEKVNGTVISGGADYQLIDDAHHHTDLEAIYCFKTDDGYNIHVRNRGILVQTENSFYFRCSPTFEAPYDSPYAWLNDNIFICVPGFGNGYISLRMYRVK